MERTQTPQSSNIESIGYDERERVLEISFKGRKVGPISIYSYAFVPLDVWHGLLHAASKGSYFAANVRGKFHATKIQ